MSNLMNYINAYIELKVSHKSPSSLFHKLPEHLMDDIISRTGVKNKIEKEWEMKRYYMEHYFATESKLSNLLYSAQDNSPDTDFGYCGNPLCEEAGIEVASNLCRSCNEWFCNDCVCEECGEKCNECGDCLCNDSSSDDDDNDLSAD